MMIVPLLLLTGLLCALHGVHGALDPDVNRNAFEIISARGFPVESHSVTTSDGYILNVFRLPQQQPAPVVLIIPGFTCSCVQMLIQSGDETLPFQLWNKGYEVWLGNFRGTTYGDTHVSLTVTDAQFWKYSFDELAKNDLPAIIQHVLQVSGKAQIASLIGHSEGGTVGLAALSTYPAVYNKVKSFIGLGTAVYMGNTQSAMVHALEYFTPVLNALHVNKFQASTTAFKDIVPGFCTTFPTLCDSVICWVAGCEDADSLDKERVPVLLSHYPDNSSVQDMDHWIQIKQTGEFKMYDFGSSSLNLASYNSEVPPAYNLTGIRTPMYLYAGSKDQFSVPVDVDQLVSELESGGANLVDFKMIDFGHGDFVWSSDAYITLYPELISIIAKYN
eukprot:TRINITY_DN1648_c0_g1_i1.p1 TRINITY_DN1648_c0_g1~~TRINITY_DN1648_c0_g1_i1.p1  ORF type:complete len:389 (+),score=102.66 TRINITY_DN1648_c0_g1_i1:27-1193(+)